jgi:predicted GIY-YIG superfamily endonuclease
MHGFWVYILGNKPFGTTYIGVTNNLIRRVFEHREGLADGSPKSMASSFSSTMSVMILRWRRSSARRTSSIGRARGSLISSSR